MASRAVEAVDSRGCSKILAGIPPNAPSLSSSQAGDWMSQASIRSSGAPTRISARGPFVGLVICVTGLSKDARKQVMDATHRLGGQYSPSLHPQCTHLVVQSYGGRKLEHALKHGSKYGLFVVTLGWFVESVKRNVRLSESHYSIKNVGENPLPLVELDRLVGYGGAEASCLPASVYEEGRPSVWKSNASFSPQEHRPKNKGSVLANDCIFVDPNVSSELKKKVVDAVVSEGAKVLDNWFAGCHASLVVCEGSNIQKYVGQTSHIVTPSWILKTVKEKHRQRLVHLSTDIARQIAVVLENCQYMSEQNNLASSTNFKVPLKRIFKDTVEERKKIVDMAKTGARNRRVRRMQSCLMPLSPITPNKLLDSICWSISEPTSSVGTYVESCTPEDSASHPTYMFFNAKADPREAVTSMENHHRLLKESEKMDIIFRGHFLTIMFPMDRFGELGPSSKTFFSDSGFTCIQVLDHIYNFYQENITADELAVAIHTDSRHGDRLRSLYACKESIDQGFVQCRRIDFLGSRKSFEMLKRVSGENSNVYELVIRA